MARDLRCLEDLDLYGAECTSALEELVQDLFHRLLERPGENLDDPDRGLGLGDLLSGPVDANKLSALIKRELQKDTRVTSADVTVTEVQNGNGPSTVTIAIVVTVDTDALNLEGYAFNVVRDSSGLHLQQAA